MNYELVTRKIKQHEGLRLTPYRDSVGKLTIGYGLNLEEGITKNEAEYLLNRRIEYALEDAKAIFRNFETLSDARKAALVDMAYNLGRSRLMQFIKLREAVHSHLFNLAAEEMLHSKWARQVGYRARDLADMMRRG